MTDVVWIYLLPLQYDDNTAGRPSFPQKQPLKRLAAFPVPQMSEQAPTYRRTQKSHPGGTVETGSEQKRDAHPQVAGYNGTSGGCLLFPAGVVCGKSTIKEIQVNEAQPEIILPIRNPVPPGSQTAAKADRISLGHNKRKNPASGINRRYSF